jgi:hypothetical protein
VRCQQQLQKHDNMKCTQHFDNTSTTSENMPTTWTSMPSWHEILQKISPNMRNPVNTFSINTLERSVNLKRTRLNKHLKTTAKPQIQHRENERKCRS